MRRDLMPMLSDPHALHWRRRNGLLLGASSSIWRQSSQERCSVVLVAQLLGLGTKLAVRGWVLVLLLCASKSWRVLMGASEGQMPSALQPNTGAVMMPAPGSSRRPPSPSGQEVMEHHASCAPTRGSPDG
eukprot:756950-Alexandrium_andersonii.AAC.1